MGDCIKRVQVIDLMAIENSVQNVKNGIQSFTDLAVKNESALAEVSAITGVTGEELDKLGGKVMNYIFWYVFSISKLKFCFSFFK